jgi:predicted PolB exonuclease-like 3'-5' exonuclease
VADFLDDLLGDSSAATAVAELPAPATVPIATVSAATVKSPRTTRKSQPLFFDLETVPDLSRIDLYDLPPVPEPAVYLAANEGPTPSELVNPVRTDGKAATIDDVKAAVGSALGKASPKLLNRNTVEACLQLERRAAKPRKGVLDIFTEMLDVISNESAVIADAITARDKAMSVCPEMCKIVAIGWAIGEDVIQSLVVGMPHADGRGVVTEVDILEKFWSLVGHAGPVCGYNVLNFDLPTIFVRSAFNSVKPRKKFDLKPWGGDVLDLMATRFPKSSARSLDWMTRVNEITSEVPDVDGSKVFALYEAGELAKIGEYVRDDVSIERAFWRKYLGFFW